jgi:hypothetical protein
LIHGLMCCVVLCCVWVVGWSVVDRWTDVGEWTLVVVVVVVVVCVFMFGWLVVDWDLVGGWVGGCLWGEMGRGP